MRSSRRNLQAWHEEDPGNFELSFDGMLAQPSCRWNKMLGSQQGRDYSRTRGYLLGL